ncbi:class III extradiol dioxygenase subunit B-like domain-containing protein [Streptomyces sparsus]
MLVAAAVCPCPPLLVPELAGGAAHELDAVRVACYDAVGVLAAARPDRLVVIGPAEREDRGVYPAGSRGSFSGYGVDMAVRLGAGPDTDRELPPSLSVAAWLLERTRWGGAPVEGMGVGEQLPPERCAEAGRELAGEGERIALLVMGDGSARRTVKAPGYFDERAVSFDADVALALGTADIAALAALDVSLAAELMVSGRSSWQVLAGAGERAGLRGRLLYDSAPYGVGYLVASWS